MESIRCRTVFISDVHLGATGCKTAALQTFLDHVECEELYLVGDIIDGWVTRQKSWGHEETNLLQTIIGMANKDCQVYLTPGNHDAFMRRLNGSEMGFMKVDHSFNHSLVDGRELLVVHGDLFDPTCVKHSWVAWLGAWGYEYLQIFNARVNTRRAKKNLRGWDFAGKIKRFSKGLTSGKEKFDDLLIESAREQGYDGVVCGHVHRPVIRTEPDGFLYINTGDWVEHGTAIIEELNGTLRLFTWDSPENLVRPKSKRRIPIRLRRLTARRRTRDK